MMWYKDTLMIAGKCSFMNKSIEALTLILKDSMLQIGILKLKNCEALCELTASI